MKRSFYFTAVLILMMTAGCGKYYQVEDPTTDKIYYTEDVDQARSSITFQDSVSRKTIILQNSEVIEISKDEFKAKTGK